MKLREWRIHPDCPVGSQTIVATVEQYATESANDTIGEIVPYGGGFHVSLSHGRSVETRIVTEEDVRTDLSWKLMRMWGDLLQKISEQTLSQLRKSLSDDPFAWVVAERLNAMVKADPQAMHALVEYRVPCDEKIVTDSPAVPVRAPILNLGMLGVINGLMPEGYKIVARFDDKTEKLIKFYAEGVNDHELHPGGRPVGSA